MSKASLCHQRESSGPRGRGEPCAAWIPSPSLYSPAPRLTVPGHGHSAAVLGQLNTLTPWCFLQASRHFQLDAPFLGAIFGSHGGGSCWLMNTAEIRCCHLILVIWGLWSAALIPARTLDPECPAPGCRTHQQPSPP